MKIICPQCEFTRQVPSDKLPTTSTMATCPQCQCRFKVHVDEQENSASPAPASHASHDSPKEQTSEPITQYAPTENAHKAYSHEQEAQQNESEAAYIRRQEEAFAAFIVDNPWEQPEKIGYFSAFYQTVNRVLFATPRFFAGLSPTGSQQRALLFFVIIGLLQITFERFWGDVISKALAPSAAGDPQLELMVTMLSPQSSYVLALLFGTALSIVELFFTASVYLLIFRFIAPERANFNLIVQVVAYSSAPMLLCLVPALGSVVGFVWGIACTAVGCRYAMRLSWGQTLMGVLPIYLIGLPLIIQFMLAA